MNYLINLVGFMDIYFVLVLDNREYIVLNIREVLSKKI